MPFLKPSRFLASSLATVLISSAPTLFAAPGTPSKTSKAAASIPSMAGWSLGEREELESAWAWRARLKGASGEARVVFGALDGKADAFLRVQSEGRKVTFQFWRQSGGKLQAASLPASFTLAGALDGELGLQASSSQVRALWNGRVVVEAWGLGVTGSIASSVRGVSLSGAQLQPTEAVVFSDDFMRASGPDEPELDGSWHRAAGVWKTSGLLGPRADAALNPNPFVFRAEAKPGVAEQQQVLATVGSWFWSDYAITASVRPVLRDANAPLVVGLGAYMGAQNSVRDGISALVDAREGRAMIVRGQQVLASSAAFDFDPNTWHRLYFEPGPNTIRLFVDGVERVRLDTSTSNSAALKSSKLGHAAQGQAALVARLSGKNYADFDDVRAASSPSQSDSFRADSPGRWTNASGEWQTLPDAQGGRRILRTAQGLTLTGASEREEGSVEATFEVGSRAATISQAALSQSGSASTWAGAAFAAQDAKNFFAARVREGRLEIVQVADGKARLLGSENLLPLSRDSSGRERQSVSVQWRDGIITARASGTVVNATVASIPAGRVGAVAQRGEGSGVALVSLQALGAAPAWGEGALPQRFEKDPLMKNWASNAAAWKRGADGFFWHTGDFFGDAALTLPLPLMPLGSRLALRLNADPNQLSSGAKLEVEKQSGGWKLSLSQDGKALGSVALSEAEWSGAEQADDAGDKKIVRSIRFVRRPLGEGRSALRAVAGSKTVFALEAPDIQGAESVKCGVALLGASTNLNSPRGRKITARVVTVERDKKAIVGVKLAPLTEAFQKSLALGDGAGALIQEVEPGTPAEQAGLRSEDVIQAVDGKKVTSIDEVIAAIGGRAVGTAVELSVWRHLGSGPLDWEKIAATTTQTLDYSFTGAPVDWKASTGNWTVSERWTCSPQWAFFNGSNAFNPTLWSRFGARGDWTLEAYVANPMDQTRGDRSPSDLNLTVGGDGRDLSSGYSWIFGGAGRTVNRVYKGDEIALDKPFEKPESAGPDHNDWFYIRLEKRQTAKGLRFRYFVNNKMLMEYADPAPLKAALDGGRFAFWTYNGGLSIARARLWYSSLDTAAVSGGRRKGVPTTLAASTSSPLPNPIGAWSARRESLMRQTALVRAEKDGARSAVKITNAQSGGDWTVYAARQPFDAAQKPLLSFDYRVGADVKVNLYVKVEDRWREIVFTGGYSSASVGGPANAVTVVNKTADGKSVLIDSAQVDGSVCIGAFENVQADNKWHRASVDLAGALRKANLNTTVQEIALAAPDSGYLRCGIGGNHEGAAYWIANLSAGKAPGVPATVAQAPRE